MKARTFVYFIAEGLRSAKRNVSLMSLSTVATSLFILGAFSLTIMNLYYLGRSLESRVQMRVFLKDGLSPKGREALAASIRKLDGVRDVSFISKEAGLARLKRELGDRGALIDLVDTNPLPDAFEVKLSDPRKAKSVATSVRRLPGVEEVNYGQEFVEKLLTFTRIAWVVSAGLVVVFAVAIVFIIGNTVRLTLFARRRELEIMKLVGATDWFIRWPFIIEGMVIGLAGATIASVPLYFLYSAGVARLSQFAPFIPILRGSELLLRFCGGLVGFGGLIGTIASGVFIKRYLHV